MRSEQIVLNGVKTDYLVFDDGRVWSNKSESWIRGFQTDNGYHYVDLYVNGERQREAIHRLVAKAFCDNPDPINYVTVNHKDGNKSNNNSWNLEWCSQSMNNKHSYDIGLHKPISSEKCSFAKYTDKIQDACKYIASGKYSLAEIEGFTGIPQKTLGEIRSKQTWRNISKDYTFPENLPKASKVGLSYEQNLKFREMAGAGLKPSEIFKELDLPRSKQLEGMVYYYRAKGKDKIN